MAISEPSSTTRTRPWDLGLFLLILFLGLALIVAGALQGRFDALWQAGWPERLRSGALASQLNHSLPKLAALESWARWHRQGAYLLAGSYGVQVRQGCEGWLFLQEEIQAAARPEVNMRQRVEMVGNVARALSQHQVSLIVLMVPDKSRIVAQAGCGLPRPASYRQRLSVWNAALGSQGVRVVDATQPLAQLAGQGKDVYWRLDSHWTQAGAAAAAQHVAHALRTAGVLPAPELQSQALADPPRERAGDLIRLAGLDSLAVRWLPAPDVETPVRFRHASIVSTEKTDQDLAAELFGDSVRPPVVLVGTSFSHAADFEGFLSQSLALPIINLARDGGGMSQAMQAYLEPGQEQRIWPSVLIWEIPERYIQTPLSESETAWLKSLG
ncbi:alginate O-acetyltransferase AlgX-related protein [Alcaligenes sp. SDU_A2]|uniref:alginate O-acetyltransferase AlgX-related protein n=1 Tax=Alcaligenes sp. SDU_A2 TaxID=3136634 RepID=UPI00311FA940